MLPKIKFDSVIDDCSLKFKIPAIEDQFIKVTDKIIMGMNIHKVFIIATAIITTAGMLYIALDHYFANEVKQFWAALIVTIVADIGIMTEFFVHQFEKARFFRSIPLAISCHFASVYYACSILPTPGFLPG